MADNVTLSSAVRSNLLSLQATTDLISRTQGRLSTGLKVATPVDDPVAYFQAKTLNDRASDFTQKKDGIDQGVSTLTAALDAVNGIESMVKQLKGLAISAKAATTSSEIANVVSQFNDLRSQLNHLATDSTYQGMNLVAGSGQTLRVDFSNLTASTLSVASEDLRAGTRGLDITTVTAAPGTTAVIFNYSGLTDKTTLQASGKITVTIANSSDLTFTSSSEGSSFQFSLGTFVVTLNFATSSTGATFAVSSASYNTLSAGEIFTFTIGSAAVATADLRVGIDSGVSTATGGVTLSTEIAGQTYIGVGFTDTLNNLITDLESNLTTLRSKAQKLGTNVSLLQTRLDFTTDYVNTLTAGASKLTLADLNEEGANLLALQTRQQLGIQALSFAGQSEQGILGLFR
ncbi:MAG: flagellin [Candidatus Zixiibacteriota bacterium]